MEEESGSGSGRARLQLHVNGKKVVVKNPDPNTVLADFLREDMGLKGLQIVCRQGGCGSCTVVVSSSADGLGGAGICSCLMPLCSVDGMHVTTIEGHGSLRTGLSSLQKAIVDHNGTQCGYCTPGMIMSMYGLTVNRSQPSPQEIEDQIDGNICRCTGYRPILDAFQSACSADRQLSCSLSQNGHCANGNIDIEDISGGLPTRLVTSGGHVVWIRACDLQDLNHIVRTNSGKKKVRLVRGNTATAIYPSSDHDILVDISRIPTLLFTSVGSKGISIGGAVTIAELMLLLKNHRDLSKHYRPLYKVLKLVANPQVRAVGSVAGNLMIVHQHGEFISDIATILLAAEVQLSIYELCLNKAEETVDLERFFEMDMKDKVISKIFLPALPVKTHFAARKIALRKANSQPIVTAACNIKVDLETDLVLPQPIIVFGGIKPYPQRAKKTENELVGKHYRDPKVFCKCLSTLQQELVVDPSYDQSKYRSSLVNYFFYYFIISAYPKDAIPNNLLSIVAQIERPISSGTISYEKGDPSEYPVSLPLPKKSAAAQAVPWHTLTLVQGKTMTMSSLTFMQTTGEVEYLDDLKFNSLHAAFVVASVSNAIIDVIDPSKALAADGVLAFLSAETIAAYGYSNNVNDSETVFASHEVQYHGQAIGLIVAVTKNIAKSAAEIVEVKYKDVKEPILTVEDALKANSFIDSRSMDFCRGEVGNYFGVADLTVEGEVSVGHQYHFHLESQRALCIPGEEGCMTVYSSTQDPSQVQQCVSVALNRPQHKITVNVKRVGGAFGAKLNRATPIAMACAMAADIVQKPVRLVLDLGTNMKLIGGRSPHLCKYKASAHKDGRITAVQMDIINNQGAHVDFEHPNMFLIGIFADGAYNIKNWRLKVRTAKTNLPPNTYIRGPMYVETAVIIETILEHISHELNLEPSVVRELNMYDKGDITILDQHLPDCNAKLIFHSLQESSDYFKRCADVKAFNEQNKWVKRGMSLVPVKFCAFWEKAQMISLLNIHTDASISIHQSGCEIGQGLDTKVSQAAAMALGTLVCDQICMEEIYVHTNTTIVSNNVQETGSSVTSELSVRCVLNACETLVKRLRAISNAISTSESKPTWHELIAKALSAGVDLQARGRSYPDVGPCGPFQYVAFAAAVTEVEVNILSGETTILRSDVLLDSGKSLNPAIDIGQLRGGFIQGLGYFLTEKYVHNKKTGKLITDGTATYKPPSSKDIPIIFNASLLPNSMNPYGVQRSKFSGEPPIASACSVFFAVKQAIAAAKSDMGDGKWFALNAPITVDQVALAANVSSDMLNVP